ncbi:neprilysin-4 [Atheta coriaria]|uniref:neprilysin-4 n=1 Tax=Dalotia coriaria TaxID=877792 RepID=UPI0031F3E104
MNIQDVDDQEKISKTNQAQHKNFWKLKHTPEEIRKTQSINMKKFMDPSADPCIDFYQYACGNWHKYNPIPPDRSSFDTFEMLRESLDSVLRDLLEENVPQDPAIIDKEFWTSLRDNTTRQSRDKRHIYDFYKIAENKDVPAPFFQVILNHSYPKTEDAIDKAKFLFKSCMNEELIKVRGIKPLLYLIKELGGWPVLDGNWDERHFDFEWLLGQLRLYNNDIIISEWVGPDIRNSEEYVIQIDQSSLGLPSRDYFIEKGNQKFVDAYKHFIATVAVLLGADSATAYEDAEQMVNFEIELSAITVSAEHRKNVSDIYVRLKIRELHSIIPQIDWFKYIGIVTNREVNPEDPIVTFSLNYLHQLVGLISGTNPRTIANYLLWRFIRHRVNNLDDRFQDAKQRFYKVLFGREQSPARWQSCISQVNSNLGMALGNLFVGRYFDERSKNDTLMMTIQLRQSFKELLMETEWLDMDTKTAAALKIDYMRLKIGYPNYILSEHMLNKRYQDVQIHPDFYFENTLSILQHLTRLEHSKLTVAVDKNFWNSPPAVVNAYYSRNKNQIMFPAGILQPPFYHRHFPRSLNYGGIGVVIGHEITHGFDDKGRLFDKDGNLKVWWKKESIEEFHERAKCLIEQYNAYVVPEANMQMDGANTQGENIADNGGIKQAFRAYEHWVLNNPERDESLPGMNMTKYQLFFLNFAQIWCGTTRPEAARNKLRTAVHSPGRFRVIGTLSNSDEFAEVYQCPVGTPMNPKNKCIIW